MVKERKFIPCPPGKHIDDNIEICIECENQTYNHGNMHPDRDFCYSIPSNTEFKYFNSTDVLCKEGWVGEPIYEDGEYEFGCVDGGDGDETSIPSEKPTINIDLHTPTGYPSKRPTKYPTRFPTRYPSRYPSSFPTQFPSEHTSLSPSLSPSIFCHLHYKMSYIIIK